MKGISAIIADELRRVLDEYDRVNAECERLLVERRNRATVASRLLQVLQAQLGHRRTDLLLQDMGIAKRVASLPRLPGRRVGVEPEGGAPRPSVPAGGILLAGTPMRMLSGKYLDWTGIVRWKRVTGSTVTYTVHLKGPNGERARTQVGQGTLGQTWAIEGEAPTTATVPYTPRPPIRRRPGSAPVQVTLPDAGSEAAGAAAVASEDGEPGYHPPRAVVPKGTVIRMLVGKFLGFAGTVVSVNVLKAGPNPDAIYTLSLSGPAGQKGRTTVKQSSLGRSWKTA
jgi:hypothetical protein